MPTGVYPRAPGKYATDAQRSASWRARHPEWNRAIQRKYDQEMRLRLSALKSGPCMDCGGRFPPECMDFDHVRGEKRDGVARMFDYSPALLEAEIAKCELVCANCHRIRTKRRANAVVVTTRALAATGWGWFGVIPGIGVCAADDGPQLRLWS